MKIIKPDSIEQVSEGLTIFLAGSIEMGTAEDWQSKTELLFKDYDLTIFNPRRESWDSSLVQEEKNPEFRSQVNWEMNMLELSDIVFMNFDENTKSPITLLELGYMATYDPTKLIVTCPKNFWRRGNVEIVCSRMGIPLFTDFEEGSASLVSRVEKMTRLGF